MAIKNLRDNAFDPALLELVKQVFARNEVKYDPTDYVPVKVSASFKIPGLIRDNSIMQLCPLTSNMRLPNLRLFYNRQDLGEVLDPYGPVLRGVDPNANAYQVLDDINKALAGELVLRQEDFYDTYLAQGDDEVFIDLHAKPDSYFYLGNYKVPVTDSKDFLLTFSINAEVPDLKVTGLRIGVEVIPK